jgi:SAM-dependent methyltransferase
VERNPKRTFSLRHSGAKISMEPGLPFDAPSAVELTRARQDLIRTFLEEIQTQAALQSALDVGCGVGYLSKFLQDLGFQVVAIDGREANTVEARDRYPGITFLTADAERLTNEVEPRDLVLCAGLLYHLENPFRVIRNLHSLTRKVLIVEGMCTPGPGMTMELLDEGESQDQGLDFVAFYPTEACLVKMLYRSGFPFVYLFRRLPNHALYRQSIRRKRERTMMVSSKVPLTAANLVLAREPVRQVTGLFDPWTTSLTRTRYFVGELRRSLLKAFKSSSISR